MAVDNEFNDAGEPDPFKKFYDDHPFKCLPYSLDASSVSEERCHELFPTSVYGNIADSYKQDDPEAFAKTLFTGLRKEEVFEGHEICSTPWFPIKEALKEGNEKTLEFIHQLAPEASKEYAEKRRARDDELETPASLRFMHHGDQREFIDMCMGGSLHRIAAEKGRVDTLEFLREGNSILHERGINRHGPIDGRSVPVIAMEFDQGEVLNFICDTSPKLIEKNSSEMLRASRIWELDISDEVLDKVNSILENGAEAHSSKQSQDLG